MKQKMQSKMQRLKQYNYHTSLPYCFNC